MKSASEDLIKAEEEEKNRAAAKDALKKAKKREQELLSKGYRYIRVSSSTEVLVECDEDGNPTEKAKIYLEKLKKVTQY